MSAAATPVQLRPLGLGEIFDRAVTLYVRNFVPLTIVALVVVLPLTIAQYFALPSDGNYQQMLSQIQHPGKSTATAQMSGWIFGYFGLALLLQAFGAVAMAASAARIYRSQRVDWRAAYAAALRHSGTVLLILLFEIVALVFAVFAGSILLGIVFGIGIFVLRSVAVLGVAFITFGAILTLAFFVFLMLFYLAFAFAYNAVGIEDLSFAQAVGRGFGRIFTRVEAGKATLICLAFVAIYIGLITVNVAIAAIFIGLLHASVVNAAGHALVELITIAFLGILIAVYYFDVGVRREGLDLQADLDRLKMPAQP